MYPRGGNAYGQQSYAAQSGYGQKKADVGGYRSQPSATSNYAGQYSAMYGSTAVGGPHSQQIHGTGAKIPGSSLLENRGGYSSGLRDSPKFGSGENIPSSSVGYGRRNESLYGEALHEYSAIEKRPYVERQGAYIGTNLQSERTKRYADSVGFNLPHEVDAYDPIEPALLLRREAMLKPQSIQSNSLDGTRRSEYLAARGAGSRCTPQELLSSYGGRLDADPHNFSIRGASSYTVADTPSILGAPPRRDVVQVDNIPYGQSSSNPGYGVSLPPGRDYSSGKGLHGPPTRESDYSGSTTRGNHSRIMEHKDERASYLREFELREEERRREKERERERERDRERLRERERSREMLERREKERERDLKRALEVRRERTPPFRDRRGSSLAKERRSQQQDSPHQEFSHRHHSSDKEIRRDYVCKVYTSSLITLEKDYLTISNRHPKLYVSPEFSKVVVHWPKENLKLPLRTPVSFEHDFVEDGSAAESNDLLTKVSTEEPSNLERPNVVWNAKVILMSGLSRTAREDLCSSKSFGDRIPHICNILRFAVLRKDQSLMAIGGPWNSTDGNDPSIDDSSLIKTAIRYAKDVTQLDLQNCHKWNRFLEIHYDRIGKDGLFSHKEVTVFFVPDLTECLPSLEAWKDQWLLQMKAVAAREHNSSIKNEKPGHKTEVQKDNVSNSVKTEKSASKLEKEESAVVGNKTDVKDGAEKGKEGKVNEKDVAVGESSGVKTTVKKKMLKQKVNGDEKEGNMEKPDADAVNPVNKVEESTEEVMPQTVSQASAAEGQDKTSSTVKTVVVKEEGKKKSETKPAKEENPVKDATEGVEKKEIVRKDDCTNKLDKETTKRKIEEPPRPGFILQTKSSKDYKFRSTDLSLDSLLDYTDRDLEDSTFELSLFAESMYEMLQYEMGCRILDFLQKLRVKFITKRNQRKRSREETHESDEKSTAKLQKTSEDDGKGKSTTDETSSAVEQTNKKMDEDDAKMDDKERSEFEDEEEPEEAGAPQDESIDTKSDKKEIFDDGAVGLELGGAEEQGGDRPQAASAELKPNTSMEGEKEASGSKPDHVMKESPIDKELMQAFRFFDRNRFGYLRVEDMRLIIHNLGKFLSYRDVKELVHCALLESNTGRDDRVLYDILVRIATDL